MSIRLDHGEDTLGEIHEINVTPFIDVILVLLIIFMIAAPLATVDVAVNLPTSNAERQPRPDKPLFLTIKPDLSLAIGDEPVARDGPAQAPEKPVFLTIKPDRSLAIGDEPVARDGLAQALEAATSGDKDQRVFLRADKVVPCGDP